MRCTALQDVTRKLVAILAADVAGYSRLMEADEEATIRALSACRQVFDKLVANHHGRVFGSAGGAAGWSMPRVLGGIDLAAGNARPAPIGLLAGANDGALDHPAEARQTD